MNEVENASATQESTQETPVVEAPIVPEAAKSDAERLKRAIEAVEKKETAKAEPPKAPEPPRPPEKKPEEMVSPHLAAVLKREQALDEKVNAFKAEKAAWEKEKGTTTDFHKRLRTQTAEALKEAGITDLEGWLRDTYYSILPEDKQPKDLRQRRQFSEEVLEVRKQNEELRNRLQKWEEEKAEAQKKYEAETQRAAEQKQIDEYYQSLPKGAESLPAEKTYLRTLIANDPNEAGARLFQAAVAYAQQHKQTPSPEQVAELVEDELSRLAQKLALGTTKTTNPAGSRASAAKSLTAKQTATPTHSRGPAATEKERLERAKERANGIWK